ncbi:MAG: polyphosphate polymerase domain-containing protein [Candidatus Gracilibacteria bacterium]|nr:polyphosphate polymerase domain-containing protein [Candidatus Gracilibacteria bacterium]
MNKKANKKQGDPKVSLTFRRFELKYQIEKRVADRIIPHLLDHMAWDEYVGEAESYQVNSLYFDSPHLKNYHEKLDGLLNRKKPRIRNYSRDFDDNSKLFFELKRRSGDVILKDRILVQGKDFKKFVADPISLLQNKEYDPEFVNEFLFEIMNYQMTPQVLVSYDRKPFFSRQDKRFRVTFDYDLEIAAPVGADYHNKYRKINHDIVVMEVKFNGAMPQWFRKVIEKYHLDRESYSKYCHGIESLYGLPKIQ